MPVSLLNIIPRVLEKVKQPVPTHHAIVGLDGFIDKIQKPVQFQGSSGTSFYTSLDQFGRRVSEASGQSAQIELSTGTVKLGGNAPIFANALAALSIRNTCLGMFGLREIHEVFHAMHEHCELITLGNAAETNALEFDDGKLILSELSTFKDLNWKAVKSMVDMDLLAERAAGADLIGLVDWCNLPHASDIWLGMLTDLIEPHVSQHPRFFFDLADPSKKSVEQVNQVLDIIGQYSKYGSVTLGLNENETRKIADFRGLDTESVDSIKQLSRLGRDLYGQLDIDRLLIHPIDGCYLINLKEELYLEGRLVKHPEVSTGGGDNFNAGYCFGQLNGLDQMESMVTAMATSGAYVQNGSSPGLKELIHYLERWLEELKP